MREIAIVFMCGAGLMVLCLWTLTVLLALKSGQGIRSLFRRKKPNEWLSIDATQAQYGDDTFFLIE